MYRLFEILESKQKAKTKPLPIELLVAQAKQPATALPYSLTCPDVVNEQMGGSTGMAVRNCVVYICVVSHVVCQEPYDPQVHERLIAEWIASCDQPFKEVEREEFRQMLSYGHCRGQLQESVFRIPSADAIHRRIMQMSDDTISDLKAMIAVGAFNIMRRHFFTNFILYCEGYTG